MSHKQEKLLQEICSNSPGANIHWRDVESLLHHLGAEIETHGARLHVVINGIEGTLHRPHHGATLSKQDVRHIRDYFIAAGVGSR